MDLDTAQLRAFVQVVETSHFGLAAERLAISQQALSKRVARLEARVGLRLFERGPTGVTVTGAGKLLQPHARTILAEIDLVASRLLGDRAGELVIDDLYEPLAAHSWLRSAADDPRLTVRSAPGHVGWDRIRALRNGDIDVAFGRANDHPWPADLHRRVALLEPVALLVGPRHRLADRVSVVSAQLRGEPLWFPEKGSPPDWYELAAELRRDLGLDIADTTATVDFEHFLQRAADGDAAATFIGMGMEPPPPPLRAVPIVEPVPVFPWAMMWHSRIPEAVVDILAEHVDSRHLMTVDQARDARRVWMPDIDRDWMLGA